VHATVLSDAMKQKFMMIAYLGAMTLFTFNPKKSKKEK